MNLLIDGFTSLTGWTSNGTISADSINAHKEYCAGGQTTSIIFKIPTGNTGKYITKTISVNLSDYNECIFWIWSRNKNANTFQEVSDFCYKIDFGGTAVYVPTFSGFLPVIFSIRNETTATRIRITALHNDADYLIISNMMAVAESLPLDIYSGIRTALLAEFASDLKVCGTITGFQYDKHVTITGTNYYLERYAVIYISDGVNTEIHQIRETDGDGKYKFTDMYAGQELLHNYLAANVYLYIPIEYGVDSTEILLPGIIIEGLTPENILRTGTVEYIQDTYTSSGSDSRREGGIYKYQIMLILDARHLEILNYMSAKVRKYIGKQKLYINNIDAEMVLVDIPTYIEPTDPNVVIHRINYIFSVEYKEDLYERENQVYFTNGQISINIQE
jgi:hypothetical protein